MVRQGNTIEATWYVARIRHGSESLVKASCAQLGVEFYIPRIAVFKRGRRFHEPLFPRYVFLGAYTGLLQLSPLRWAPGIHYFLGSDASPSPLPGGAIASIREKVDGWNAGGWATVFRPGMPIRVAAGPLSGLDAIFQGYVRAKDRCRILLTLVGRPLVVEVAVNALDNSALIGECGSGQRRPREAGVLHEASSNVAIGLY